MPTVYRSAMQAYMDNCRAANAYNSSAYPREYTTSHHQRPSDMSRRSVYPYPVEDRSRDDDRYHRRSQHSRGDSYRRPPPPPEPTRLEPPTRRRRPSTSTAATPPSPGPPPRKSVRFSDGERPTTRRPSGGASSMQQPTRPKTFAKDAPPVAISESAKDTARRLYHRRPSDGGRPSARPTVQREDSTRTMNTTRAEMGTQVGGRRRERREEREPRDYRERERYSGGRSRRR